MSTNKRPRRSWLAFGAIASLAAVVLGGAVGATQAGCQTQPILEPLRSLERSGAITYICLDTPLAQRGIARPIIECTGFAASDPFTFNEDDAGTIIGPHLYAMVTQTSRGEVAVVDMTAQTDPVIDENPNIPGANFLPIGAQPVDIVATPGSTATFVGVAEIGREGIFALPSSLVRPSTLLADGGVSPEPARAVPELSSWPACSLPSAPGAMLLIDDPPTATGAERARCDDKYGQLPPAGANGDLGSQTEGKGRRKLVVAMPDQGGIVVIDAQTLLDRAPGSFEACPVDRWLPLQVDFGGAKDNPQPKKGPACVNAAAQGPDYTAKYTPRPAGMSYADGVLYVADLGAPVIHVIDLGIKGGIETPCEPHEQSPLLPRTLTGLDLTRVVLTKKVTAGPPTGDLKHRYVYAVDEKDSSMMVFDVGPEANTPYPLVRPHPEWDPLSSRDRVRLPSPVSDVLIVQHDAAQPLPTTGVAPEGARCDPNPAASCVPGGNTCDIGAVYRNDSSYELGANPNKLRGLFAFAALTNGHLGVIDIEDYDAPCRIPAGPPSEVLVPLAGCDPDYQRWLPSKVNGDATLLSAGEVSCNAVLPNQPRDMNFTAPVQDAGFHQPSLETLPILYDLNGSVITRTDTATIIGTIPNSTIPHNLLPFSTVSVAGTPLGNCIGANPSDCVDPTTGISIDQQGHQQNTIFMNLEDPRAQAVDEAWTATFEGAIPGFSAHLGTLDFKTKPSRLSDTDGRFCDSGVQSENSVREILQAYHTKDLEQAVELADYVQVFTDLPLETDPFWEARDSKVCSFAICNATFGTIDTPTPFRDLPIVEAYQDHLDVLAETHSKVPQPDLNGVPQDPKREPIDLNVVNCCFPPPVAYNIRVGNQWLLSGLQTGFLHHVIPDPTTGVCRNSCDATLERLNGRVYPVPASARPVVDQDFSFAHGTSIYAFMNPMFRFAITNGGARDDNFQFSTNGSFQPLEVVLAPDATTLMTPVAVSLVPPLGELLAVVDGGHQGITTVTISAAAVSRQFF